MCLTLLYAFDCFLSPPPFLPNGRPGYGEFGQYEKREETTSSSESYSSDDGITIQKLRDELHQPKRRIVGVR